MKREATSPLERAQALIDAGDAPFAVALLRSQLAAGRGGILTRVTLGRALVKSGELAEALAVFREAALLFPRLAEAALALGEALMAAGHIPTAIAEFQRALRLDPASQAASYALGCAWLEAGEAERAQEILIPIAMGDGAFRDSASAQLQHAENMKHLNRSPPGYIRHLFDQFSANYDRNMVQDLRYSAPAVLRSLADMLLAGVDGPRDVLDLGCGTGLAGEAFKALSRRLDGVDLSPLMVERAKARSIYDALFVADIETFLEHSVRRYDLLIAADTLVYFGDLSRVFSAAQLCLTQGGHFLFTVEKQGEDRFALGPRRRFRHSGEYVRAEAERASLECVGMLDCVPRIEAGQPVNGLAVALRKA